jgi:hypothetical protein
MARRATWGDELTLRATVDAFGVVLHLITSDAEHWHNVYTAREVKSPRVVFLAYLAPIHYNHIAMLVDV